MALSFDGANDNVNFGSEAAIDAFNPKSVMMWIRPTITVGDVDCLLSKGASAAVGGSGWEFDMFSTAAVNTNGALRFYQNRATVDGQWDTPNNSLPGSGVMTHVAVSYNHGNDANDPDIYIDGVLQAEVEVLTPVGAAQSDAAVDLIAGENSGAANDYAGFMGWVVYDSALKTAAEVNRHRWWGVSPGANASVITWYPMHADPGASSVTNYGSHLGAFGTTSGAVYDNANLPRVERCWGSLMGVGR